MEYCRLYMGAQQGWAPLYCLLPHPPPHPPRTTALCSVVTTVTTENSLPQEWQRYKKSGIRGRKRLLTKRSRHANLPPYMKFLQGYGAFSLALGTPFV